MAVYKIIIDASDDVEEVSAILARHDETGDVDPDDFIKAGSVCAALAYCNSKVSEADRGDYKPEDFINQVKRIDEMVDKYYQDESYSVVRTAIDLFIATVTTSLICALNDQKHTPLFKSIKEDLSLVFSVMDGKDETKNPIGVSAIN